MGVLKYDTLMGKYGFRALFISQYVCVYKIENDTVFIYHIADARKNYMYHAFATMLSDEFKKRKNKPFSNKQRVVECFHFCVWHVSA